MEDDFRADEGPRSAWVRRTLRYFRPHVAEMALAACLLAVTSGLSIAGPLILRHALDVDVAGRDLAGLTRTTGLYVAVLVTLVVASWIQRISLNKVGQGAMATLRSELLRRIVHLPVQTFDEQPSGKLIARVMSDVDALRQLMTSTFLMVLGDVLLFAAMAGTMIWIDRQLACVALAILPLVGAGFVFFQKRAGPRFAAARARSAEVTGFLAEHLRTMPVLQALDRTEWVRRRCRELGEARFQADVRAERVVISFFNGITMTEALGTAAITLVGGARVAHHTLTIGTLVLFFEYVRRYYEPVHRLTEEMHVLERARAAASRVYSLLDQEPEPAVVAVEAAGPQGEARPPAAPGRAGELRFEDVWFSYRASPDESSWVLRGVSFTVPAGARFALVGPTGHGKSTILSLLLRFHVAARGRVLVDGEDVRRIPLPRLRERFGLVLQDVRLFPGTLAENVLLGQEGGDETARAALASVGALDVVARLPDGLATVLGEAGAGLSDGERQLVSCARALVREPRILLLDEATSSVDPATEARLQEALERVSRGRTLLTIAHRLATVRSADRILVVERGEIVETGTRDELLRAGGRYAALERLQALAVPSLQARERGAGPVERVPGSAAPSAEPETAEAVARD